MNVVWSPTSIADLRHVRTYIAARNPTAARAVAQKIREGVERLATFPAMGRPGQVPGTRELVIPGTPFFVAYDVADGVVRILAVVHGARRWPADG